MKDVTQIGTRTEAIDFTGRYLVSKVVVAPGAGGRAYVGAACPDPTYESRPILLVAQESSELCQFGVGIAKPSNRDIRIYRSATLKRLALETAHQRVLAGTRS